MSGAITRMARTSKPAPSRSPQNQRRTRAALAEVLDSANRRVSEQTNRRGGNRERKRIRSVVEEMDFEEGLDATEWLKRLGRWSLALVLLPLCWVTTWTFLARFSEATVYQEFWKSPEFWYFATGALLMIGWFWSGLLHSFFLLIYVLGHELTHAIFVVLHLGKVMDFHVGMDGGYVTTNKSNLLIALSPYFVPFWSIIGAFLFAGLRYFAGLSAEWDRLLYGMMGVTWTFHMIWTLWMIPRDQPDLKENGTFLSLVVIYLANLLVLVGLLCLAARSPLADGQAFARDWFRHAATWGDVLLRWGQGMIHGFRSSAGL